MTVEMLLSLTLAALVAAVIATIGAVITTRAIMRNEQDKTDLRRDLDAARDTLSDLSAKVEWEQIQRKLAERRSRPRHTTNVVAGLQDSMALDLRTLEELDTMRALVETNLGVKQTMAKGPHAYDPERPSGKR